MCRHAQRNFRFFTFVPWVILGTAGFMGLVFVFGLVVMLLWNHLMPVIFGLPVISYWQAWGLLILSQILFKGPRHFHPNPHHLRDNEWKEKFRKRFRRDFTEQTDQENAERD